MPIREILPLADWVKIYRRVVSDTRLLPQVLGDDTIHLPQKKVNPESYLMCCLCGFSTPKLTCNPIMQVVMEMQFDCINGNYRVVTYVEHWAFNIVR